MSARSREENYRHDLRPPSAGESAVAALQEAINLGRELDCGGLRSSHPDETNTIPNGPKSASLVSPWDLRLDRRFRE